MSLMSNYTVSFDEKAELWMVRRHGSVKNSEGFTTQKDAITRAKDLALKSSGTINIKNKDGKVRAIASKSNKNT